ncbi:hypothetical protein J6590_017749 [Homalodisca vitripennis]|nr:hypothetical protein J6590_017749 [Homalodisca vitripennis]
MTPEVGLSEHGSCVGEHAQLCALRAPPLWTVVFYSNDPQAEDDAEEGNTSVPCRTGRLEMRHANFATAGSPDKNYSSTSLLGTGSCREALTYPHNPTSQQLLLSDTTRELRHGWISRQKLLFHLTSGYWKLPRSFDLTSQQLLLSDTTRELRHGWISRQKLLFHLTSGYWKLPQSVDLTLQQLLLCDTTRMFLR